MIFEIWNPIIDELIFASPYDIKKEQHSTYRAG